MINVINVYEGRNIEPFGWDDNKIFPFERMHSVQNIIFSIGIQKET